MTERFIEWNPYPDGELNGKLESEAHKLECRIAPRPQELNLPGGSLYHWPMCIASRCNHWRWLHRGGMTHEKQTFQSEWPAPEGGKAPADVPDGWTFASWDYAGVKSPPKPRFWASRPTSHVVLPRGFCGLAGDA